MNRLLRFLCPTLVALALTGAVAVMHAPNAGPARADSYPEYTVDATTAAGGVYARFGPHTDDTNRTAGYGVYPGDLVELFCGVIDGSPVGQYSNQTWHFIADLSRPSEGTFWLNDHYVDSPNSAGQLTPGETTCSNESSNPLAPTTPYAAVYYSPYELNDFYPSNAQYTTPLGRSAWSSGAACDAAKAYAATPFTVGGVMPVTQLAGWSLGRVGPLYFLHEATLSDELRISNILLIDPGNYSDLAGNFFNQSCDATLGGGVLLADWLETNPSATLVVLSGDTTTDSNNPINGYANAGIQNVYFNDIRAADSQYGGGIRNRVLVCNYTMPGVDVSNAQSMKQSHEQMVLSANKYIGQPPLMSCPQLDGMTFTGSWHP